MISTNAPINTSLTVRSLSIFSEKLKAIPRNSLLVTAVALGALGLLVVMIMKYRSRTNPGVNSSSPKSSSNPPEQTKPDQATSSSSSSPTSSSSAISSEKFAKNCRNLSEVSIKALNFVLNYQNRPEWTDELTTLAAIITTEYFKYYPQKLREYDKNLDLTPECLPVKKTLMEIQRIKPSKTRHGYMTEGKMHQMNANYVELVDGQPFIITQNPFADNGKVNMREKLFWRCIMRFSIVKVYDLKPRATESHAFDITKTEQATYRSKHIKFEKINPVNNTNTQIQSFECTLNVRSKERSFSYNQITIWHKDNPRLNRDIFCSLIEHMSVDRKVQNSCGGAIVDPILLSCDTEEPLGPMFAVACALKHLAKNGGMTRDNYKILVLTLVLSIRIQRNAAAVSDSQIEDLCGYADGLLQKQADSTV